MDMTMAHRDGGGGYHAAPGYVTLMYMDIGGQHVHPLIAAACPSEVAAAVEAGPCYAGTQGAWRALVNRLCELGVECDWDADDDVDGQYIIGRLARREDDEAPCMCDDCD